MRKRDFELLGKRLLGELPEFKVFGDLLLKVPINHILRGLYFERDSSVASYFRIGAFFQPLCVPKTHVSLNFSERLEHPGPTPWDFTSPPLDFELATVIEQIALPFLAETDTPLGMARKARALGYSRNFHGAQSIALTFARAGLVKEAIDEIDAVLPKIRDIYPWQTEIRLRLEAFRHLLLTNPDAAQKQLDEWEAETVRNLRLEKFFI